MKRLLKPLYTFAVRIPKTLRVAISVFSLGLIYFGLVAAPFEYIPYGMIILGLCTYALVFFALLEDVRGGEWFMLFYSAVLWSLVWYAFFYLTPVRWLTRASSLIGYMAVMYIIISINNIFNVAVARGLPLHRAANKLNQFITVIILFTFFQVLFAFSSLWIANMAASFVVILGLTIHMYWGNHLQSESKVHVPYGPLSLLTTIYASVLVGLVCFIPFISPLSRSAILAGFMYIFIGLLYLFTQEKIYISYTREYYISAVVLALIFVLSVQW